MLENVDGRTTYGHPSDWYTICSSFGSGELKYDTGPCDSDRTDSEPDEMMLFQAGKRSVQSLKAWVDFCLNLFLKKHDEKSTCSDANQIKLRYMSVLGPREVFRASG